MTAGKGAAGGLGMEFGGAQAEMIGCCPIPNPTLPVPGR